jgi:hypothetical protein
VRDCNARKQSLLFFDFFFTVENFSLKFPARNADNFVATSSCARAHRPSLLLLCGFSIVTAQLHALVVPYKYKRRSFRPFMESLQALANEMLIADFGLTYGKPDDAAVEVQNVLASTRRNKLRASDLAKDAEIGLLLRPRLCVRGGH